MRASRSWMLVVTLLLVASMTSTEAVCSFSDRETSAGNTATGFVPGEWTQTTIADFKAGTASRTDTGAVPGSVVLGVDLTDPGVYVLAGGSSKAFYRYNLTSRAWVAVAPIPVTLGDGSSMVYDGTGHVYALIGGSSTALYRYDVLSNVWALFSNAPGSIGNGGDIAWDGSALYVLRGSTGQQIWRLDPATGTWTLQATMPAVAGSGASIVAQNGILYVAQGGSTKTFRQYVLATSTWTVLGNSRGNIGPGSDMVTGPGGALYCSYGSASRQLERYDGGTNTWTTLQSQTATVNEGGGLAYDGSATIYSTNGNAQNYFNSYNTTLDRWTSMTSLPATVTTGGCIVYVPAVRIGYYSSGTLTSVTFDTGAMGTKFIQAFWDRTAPSSTALAIEVRASDSLSGGAPASTWQSLGTGTSGSMSGLTGRYVQWRVTLTTSNPGVTPGLQEVRVYYRA